MRSNFLLFLLSSVIAVTAYGQSAPSPLLNIGDPAPALRMRAWLKGEPVPRFEKGRVYVLEFWATWCRPCIAAMPHLSALAAEYRDRVTIVAVDIYEKNTTSLKSIKAFVDSMGNRMDFPVAAEDNNYMATGWLDASGEQDKGIPRSFVVNAEGMLAWIGYPTELDEVLPKIINKNWDIHEALAKRNSDRRLEVLDQEASDTLNSFVGDPAKPGDLGKPDAALFLINEMVSTEPKLKYAPLIAFHTFSSLLKTNTHNAFEYGKKVLLTTTYEKPACYFIIDAIKWYSDKLNLPAEIYQLCAEAYQVEIDQIPFPEIVNTSKLYNNMAAWYWKAKDQSRAIAAEQKAIDSLKGKKDFSAVDLAAFELRLQEYTRQKVEGEGLR